MMALSDPHGDRRRELVAMDIYFDGESLMAGFSKKDQRNLGLPASVALGVDENAYQRPLSLKHVEDVRRNWDVVAADEPTLSFRSDGSMWIINGQHVIAAAIQEGERELLAWVYFNLDVADEADMRLKKNFSRGDTALEKFYAQLTRERKAPGWATEVRDLLAEFDTHVNRAPNNKVGINCVGTVERLYKRDGGAILRRGLRTLQAAFGAIEGDVARSALLEATCWFMTVHHGELRWKQLVTAMAEAGTDELDDEARGFKRLMGGAEWINTYRAILKSYNSKSRKQENKLVEKTSRYTAVVPAAAIREEEDARRRKAA